MNLVRSINKSLNSPVNRINILAKNAILGLNKNKSGFL
jgi:hypothetical protein